ncbi:hypothetical protein KR038_001624 [Drosophila bunnanda]|nr:hypothetical protein KR038_001624 [Drosophila bunnanda]
MCDNLQCDEPNVIGLHVSESEGWHRHVISGEDTMAQLALKYNTSIGLIRRANRMHGQDVLQTRRHIWVPMPTAQCQIFQVQEPMQIGREEEQPLLSSSANSSPFQSPRRPLRFRSSYDLLPHFQREHSPNRNYLAEESDPLLIT